MVKHTQTIRRLLPINCLNVFDHFKGLALKRLKCEKSWDVIRKIYIDSYCLSVVMDSLCGDKNVGKPWRLSILVCIYLTRMHRERLRMIIILWICLRVGTDGSRWITTYWNHPEVWDLLLLTLQHFE